MRKVILSGCEALAEGALRAGLQAFAGYPITPGTELLEYLSEHLPRKGGVFIQAASEVEAISILNGAAAAGARVMTTTSGPGLDLMHEGIGSLVARELPAVIVDLCRVGPGGLILPYQGDYWPLTRGGGHGGYHTVVYAPSTVQEAADLCFQAFEVADRYRHPVAIVGDVILANTSETIVLPEPVAEADMPPKPWALTGAKDRPPNRVCDGASVRGVDGYEANPAGEGLGGELYEQFIQHLVNKYKLLVEHESRVETDGLEGCKVCVVAYGTVARIVKTAVKEARVSGLQVGLVRPITIWPFPGSTILDVAGRGTPLLAVEMSFGQMAQDVERAARGRAPVHFYGRYGGMVPTVAEVRDAIARVAAGEVLPVPVGD